MELDKWIGSYKVRAFSWIDGKRIYFNVQYYAPGQSVERPPAWDKTVYVADNEAGKRLVFDFTNSLVEASLYLRSAPDVETNIHHF